MANPLPEVTPLVTSMPTTGWHIQTGGSARTRKAANKGSATQGIFDIAGIPGHTHNACAVASVDADYTRYRAVALNVAANVWAYGALALPINLLTDSIDPDNADERYDRAIERCIGYITLQPENCQSSIREPTRSIGEVRTLVAPKARLDTMTYVEELGGWRVPVGATDPANTQALLSSAYPDIALDMRPLTLIRAGRQVVLDSTPSNLFLQSSTHRYSILSTGFGHGIIGTTADGATLWDGTVTFKWDPDAHRYASEELTVRLSQVHELTLAGVATLDGAHPIIYDGGGAAGHRPRLYVTFPASQTSVARDGYCWLSNVNNEEALSVATQSSGLSLASRVAVEVTGIQDHIGPFSWIGMPAYRIPVGGQYAHPGPDILQDPVSQYWDRFDAFREETPAVDAQNGLLQYAHDYEEAEALVVAAELAGQNGATPGFPHQLFTDRETSLRNRLGPHGEVHKYSTRQAGAGATNGRMFHTRSAGILHSLTDGITEYDNEATILPYTLAYGGNNVAAGALRIDQPTTILSELGGAGLALSDWADAYAPGDNFSKSGNITFRFDQTINPWQAHFAQHAARYDTANAFVAFPVDVDYFHSNDAGEPYNGDYQDAEEHQLQFTIRMVCPLEHYFVRGTTGEKHVECEFDYEGTGIMEATTAKRYDNLDTLANAVVGAHAEQTIRVKGIRTYVEADFDPADHQAIRNHWRPRYLVGNRYEIAAGDWLVEDGGGPDNFAHFFLKDFGFAGMGSSTRLYFTTIDNTAAGVNGRKLHFWMERVPACEIIQTLDNANALHQSRVITEKDVPCWTWNPALNAGAGGLTRVRFAALNHVKANGADGGLLMYVLGKDWVGSHITSDPFAAVRADSQSRGAVFQSKKRISQHICAPVLNPNSRIAATAPLNHDSRHLPPEMRDFRLRFDDVDWSRLGAPNNKVTLNELTLFEFNGGNQKQAAESNILYLPQFQEFYQTVPGTSFSLECFSSLGSPSFYCVFCRSENTDILQQPIIKRLSIFNGTTKKKSNTITDVSVSQLYHLTQRNVHAYAEYDRKAFKRRQTILLASEDVGLMGLHAGEYQKQKRVQYTISGTTDQPGRVFVLFIYNNRGLHVDGRRLNVVTLHE